MLSDPSFVVHMPSFFAHAIRLSHQAANYFFKLYKVELWNHLARQVGLVQKSCSDKFGC